MEQSVENYMNQIVSKALADGFQHEALHTYTDANGQPLYWRVRLKHRQTGDKWIRPFYLKHTDPPSYCIAEPPAPAEGKPLYRLHQIAARPEEPVFVVEGEWCADHLSQLGLLATTSGGATSAANANWQPLANRRVIIWPDNDVAGIKYAEEVAANLLALKVEVSRIDLAELGLPDKADAVDWLARNQGAGAEAVMALPTLPCQAQTSLVFMPVDEPMVEDEVAADNERPNQVTKLLAFVEERVMLFRDEMNEVYAQERETKKISIVTSQEFKEWLQACYYQTMGQSVRDAALREALATLAGIGRFGADCHRVYLRVGQHEKDYYLDLAQHEQSRVVKISAGHWQVIEDAPVMFRRPQTMQPLPDPMAGGTLDALWQIVNIPADCRVLVVAWLCECLRMDTPFPLLELTGEQGSAKSTTQKFLRRLIDPNACDLRSPPKGTEECFLSAGNSWLLSYENISYLSAATQDALCTIATGGGMAKRQLYSNSEEVVISVKRPIVLNGISIAVTAQDLVDRTVSIDTPTISDRHEINQLDALFERQQPQLLGALLDIMAKALALLPDIQLPAGVRPRLIEFARLGMAVSTAMGHAPDVFIEQFTRRRQEAIERTLEASPVAMAVLEWFGKNPHGKTQTVKQWLETLNYFRPDHTDAWPRSCKGLGDSFRRVAPALREYGIQCRANPKTGGYITWTIEPLVQMDNKK